MSYYRKKPVVIEAHEVTYEHIDDIVRWINASLPYVDAWVTIPTGIMIPTLEGDMLADMGDYVIRGVQNEFYPCKPDIFEVTYEEVGD